MHGSPDGDPAKAARALDLALQADNPPLRLQVGADSIAAVRAHAEQLLRDLAIWEQVGSDVRIDPSAPHETWQSRRRVSRIPRRGRRCAVRTSCPCRSAVSGQCLRLSFRPV